MCVPDMLCSVPRKETDIGGIGADDVVWETAAGLSEALSNLIPDFMERCFTQCVVHIGVVNSFG